MNNKFEIPARDKITITSTDEWISITQECAHLSEQKITIHIDDLQKIINHLNELAGAGGHKQAR